MNILSCQQLSPDSFLASLGRRLRIIARSFEQGAITSPSLILHYSLTPLALLSVRHWHCSVCQTPQARLASPKPPQPLVDIKDVAFPPARLLWDVCTTIWEFAALQVTS